MSQQNSQLLTIAPLANIKALLLHFIQCPFRWGKNADRNFKPISVQFWSKKNFFRFFKIHASKYYKRGAQKGVKFQDFHHPLLQMVSSAIRPPRSSQRLARPVGQVSIKFWILPPLWQNNVTMLHVCILDDGWPSLRWRVTVPGMVGNHSGNTRWLSWG